MRVLCTDHVRLTLVALPGRESKKTVEEKLLSVRQDDGLGRMPCAQNQREHHCDCRQEHQHQPEASLSGFHSYTNRSPNWFGATLAFGAKDGEAA